MRLINTRPADDAASLTASLAQMGHTVVEAPLMTIRYDEDADLDLTDAQALLATSANGIRAFARRTARRDIAVFAVGDATARAAEQAGFQQVRSAAGDVAALAELVIGALEPAAGWRAIWPARWKRPVLKSAGPCFMVPKRRPNCPRPPPPH